MHYAASLDGQLENCIKIAIIAKQRPPTWEECNNIAEVFVYGVSVWSYYVRNDLDRLVVIVETREFMFNWLIRSEVAQNTLKSVEVQTMNVKELLMELVLNETYLTSSSLVLSTKRGGPNARVVTPS